MLLLCVVLFARSHVSNLLAPFSDHWQVTCDDISLICCYHFIIVGEHQIIMVDCGLHYLILGSHRLHVLCFCCTVMLLLFCYLQVAVFRLIMVDSGPHYVKLANWSLVACTIIGCCCCCCYVVVCKLVCSE